MTQLLQEAFRKASELPEERQDQIGQMLLAVVTKDTTLPVLTDEQIAQVKTSLEEAEGGHFASEDEVKAVYEKYGA